MGCRASRAARWRTAPVRRIDGSGLCGTSGASPATAWCPSARAPRLVPSHSAGSPVRVRSSISGVMPSGRPPLPPLRPWWPPGRPGSGGRRRVHGGVTYRRSAPRSPALATIGWLARDGAAVPWRGAGPDPRDLHARVRPLDRRHRRRAGPGDVQRRRPGARHRPGRRHRRGADDGVDDRRDAAPDPGRGPHRVLEPQPAGGVAQGRHVGRGQYVREALLRLRRRHAAVPRRPAGRRRLPHRQPLVLLPGVRHGRRAGPDAAA